MHTRSRNYIQWLVDAFDFWRVKLSLVILMLTVQRVVKGRPPIWAFSPRQQTNSSWLFSRADLHTSLNPTEGRDNGWWNVLPSHWPDSQPLRSRGNKKHSSHNNNTQTFLFFLYFNNLQWISSLFLVLLLNTFWHITVWADFCIILISTSKRPLTDNPMLHVDSVTSFTLHKH